MLAAALSLPAALRAQSGTSTISGIVKDISGGAIPGVQVRVVNEETRVTVETLTNHEGLYRVMALVPGQYRVETELSGFEPVVRRQIALEVGQTLAIDVTLDVEKRTESIDVVAATPLLESQSSNVAQTVTREMLAALPLPNRAASSLASLAPGVIMIDTASGTAENYPVFSAAGGRARNQNFVLDGGNASNAVGLTRPQQLTSLPVDAMQEFRVITNNYSAEYGHSTGGVVTMSTRAGTNRFHGRAFEALRNDRLDARNFFATAKPAIRLNQFGATLGGPVEPNRSFFFGSWERTRQLTSETIVSTVPTLSNRHGDFSDLRSSSGQPIAIYDPVTEDQRTLGRWFNTSAFVDPAPFTFGNLPRSVLRRPGITTTDLTLEKRVPLTSRVRFDLRVEAYNLLNHTNFNIPGFTLGAADFGVISSACPARTVQLGARLGF